MVHSLNYQCDHVVTIGFILSVTISTGYFIICSLFGLLGVLVKMLVLIELSSPEKLQQIVMNQFSRVAQHERCSFFGNVTLGSSISLTELRELYHVVRC
jgi:hypothetical protein